MDRSRRFSAFVASGYNPHPTILEALHFTREFLSTCTLSEGARDKLAIVVEELVSNTLRHGKGDPEKPIDVAMWLSLDDTGDEVVIEMEDNGTSFDPSATDGFAGPDPETGGGVGLAIIQAWGEDLSYMRMANRNVLRLKVS